MEDDVCIMPIEKIFDTGNKVSSTSKRLEREDYWCRELCTFYPYGLNDNVREVGNISKMKGQGQLVVNTLFNRNKRKFRVHKHRKRRKERDLGDLTDSIQHLQNYKTCNFCFNIRSFILSLPRKCMCMVWNMFHNYPRRACAARVQ